MSKLTGQRVLIVGGSSGIGKAVARQALAQDAEVHLASRSEKKLQAAAEDLAKPGRLRYHILDTRHDQEVQAFFRRVPPLEHLVITAGQTVYGPFGELPVSAALKQFNSKFFGPYRVARYALNHLQRGGSITFFSGILAQRPAINCTALTAVNAAIEGLTRALAMELGERGFRVNCVSPGIVATEAYANLPEAERRKMFSEAGHSLPVDRIGTADEIASGVMLLMTNGYMTGEILVIDGGHHVRR